jgi:hypothetical protein
MPIRKVAFIRVRASDVEFMSPDNLTLKLVDDAVKERESQTGVKIERPTTDWLLIKVPNGHDSAIVIASWIIRFLYHNGWSEMTYMEYIDGHWFHK